MQCVAHNNWIERLIKKIEKILRLAVSSIERALIRLSATFWPVSSTSPSEYFSFAASPSVLSKPLSALHAKADWWRHAEVKQQLNWPVRELSVAYECVLWLRQQSGAQWVGPVMAERTAHSQQLQPLTTKETKSLIYQSFLGCLLIDGKFFPRETRENLSLFHLSFSVNEYWKF